MNKNIENAVKEYIENNFQEEGEDFSFDDTIDAFILGYMKAEKDFKEKSITGEVVKNIENQLSITTQVNDSNLKFGDVVNIVIIDNF